MAAPLKSRRGRPPGKKNKEPEIIPPDELDVVAMGGFEPDFGDDDVPVATGMQVLDDKEKKILQLAKMAFLTDGEAAAFLGMSATTFGRLLRKKDPATGVTYREIWERGDDRAKASLKIQMWRQAQMMNSAGVTAAHFLAKNMLGFSDKRTEYHEGTVRVEHQAIPADKDLAQLSVAELENLAGDLVGTGKKRLRH